MNVCQLLFLVLFLLDISPVSAQQPKNLPLDSRIFLDVVVNGTSGAPVSNLQQQDFTIMDNNVPQPLASFRAVDGRKEPIELTIVIDAANANWQTVAYERVEIKRFLGADQGKLPYPTKLAVLTDTGMHVAEGFSMDGSALGASMDQYTAPKRNPNDASQLLQLSLNGLEQLAEYEAPLPGRKIILWLSPEWPLLTELGPELEPKDRQEIFTNIVYFSTKFLQGRMTLYGIDPLGAAEAGHSRPFLWKQFVKGISKMSEVQYGDLGLEVLATQSGGEALSSSNDIASLLQKCVADLGSYYELSFNPPPGKLDEYHHLEIRLAKPDLTARTRQGYYTSPKPHLRKLGSETVE